MRFTSFALALVVVPACDAKGGPPPVAPAPVAAAATPVASVVPPVDAVSLDLNLPALTAESSPIVGDDREHPLQAYRLRDGRLLIHDGHHDRIAVLDPATGTRTDLGEAVLFPVPGLGWLFAPKRVPVRYCDIDPAAPRLRELWSAPEGEADVLAITHLAGLDGGAPLFVVTFRGRSSGAAGPDAQLVRVRGPGDVVVRDVVLPAGMSVPGTDGVRGRRLLMLGAHALPHSSVDPMRGPRSTVPAFILDLDSATLRPLGPANVGWTRGTAIPHPYITLRWSDHDPHGHNHGWDESCVNLVDVASERLTPCPTADL